MSALSRFLASRLHRPRWPRTTPPQAAFNKLVDEYFDFYFQFHPTAGTQAGFHQYDGKLEDFSRSGVDAEIAGLLKFQKQFGSIQSSATVRRNRPATWRF